MLAAKHIHTASAAREIDHLLPGDITWTHADSFPLNAVVATEEQMTGMLKGRGKCLLYQANLFCQRFQQA